MPEKDLPPQARRASAPEDLSDLLAAIVARASQSVVAIHSTRSRSSGFIWRPGLIVTADEALAEEGDISVSLPGGERAAAVMVGRDATTDIALLRIDHSSLLPVEFHSGPIKVGALASVVGSRDGEPTAAFGAVSCVGGPWRSVRGGEIDTRVELDVALRRNSEGALALDASGRSLGMAVFGARQRVIVIPAATIERVAGRLQTHGRIARGYLGLGIHSVQLDDDQGLGIMVMKVDPNGPGAVAGARQGDVIIKWGGHPVRDVKTLLRALGPDSIGSTVKLSLRRGGESAEANLTIGERPET